MKFILKQIGLLTWVIISPAGKYMCEPKNFANQYLAEEFCKAYLSSWISCVYTVEKLEKRRKNENK